MRGSLEKDLSQQFTNVGALVHDINQQVTAFATQVAAVPCELEEAHFVSSPGTVQIIVDKKVIVDTPAETNKNTSRRRCNTEVTFNGNGFVYC